MEEQRLEPEALVHGFLGRNTKSGPWEHSRDPVLAFPVGALTRPMPPPRQGDLCKHTASSQRQKAADPSSLAWNTSSPSGLTGVRVTRLGNLSGESRFKGEQEVVSCRAKVRRPGNLSDETIGQ